MQNVIITTAGSLQQKARLCGNIRDIVMSIGNIHLLQTGLLYAIPFQCQSELTHNKISPTACLRLNVVRRSRLKHRQREQKHDTLTVGRLSYIQVSLYTRGPAAPCKSKSATAGKGDRYVISGRRRHCSSQGRCDQLQQPETGAILIEFVWTVRWSTGTQGDHGCVVQAGTNINGRRDVWSAPEACRGAGMGAIQI